MDEAYHNECGDREGVVDGVPEQGPAGEFHSLQANITCISTKNSTGSSFLTQRYYTIQCNNSVIIVRSRCVHVQTSRNYIKLGSPQCGGEQCGVRGHILNVAIPAEESFSDRRGWEDHKALKSWPPLCVTAPRLFVDRTCSEELAKANKQ